MRAYTLKDLRPPVEDADPAFSSSVMMVSLFARARAPL